MGKALVLAALAVFLCLARGAAEDLDADSGPAAWGDRSFAADLAAGLPSIRSQVEESFEAESGWACSMAAEDGIGALKTVDYSGGRALGLKIEFLRRSRSTALLTPPRPILVEPRCVMLSLRVLGRDFGHELSIVVLDYYGRESVLPMGRLDFSGWKTLRAYVPAADPEARTGIVQDDRHFSRPGGLRIAGLRLDFDQDKASGSFYVYFANLSATIEGFEPGGGAEAPLPSPSDAATTAHPSTAAPREGEVREAAPAIPPAGPKADPAAEGTRILSELSRRIAAALVYPPAARRRGQEGTLVASFSVDERGALVWERVDRSSGSALLDEAGLELLRGVFPVDNSSGLALELRISISYKLD